MIDVSTCNVAKATPRLVPYLVKPQRSWRSLLCYLSDREISWGLDLFMKGCLTVFLSDVLFAVQETMR